MDKFLANLFFGAASGASSDGVFKSDFIRRLTMSLETELETLRALC